MTGKGKCGMKGQMGLVFLKETLEGILAGVGTGFGL